MSHGEAAIEALAATLHDPDECRQCMVRKSGGHCSAWNGALLRAASIITRLGVNGYVVVPRHLLTALTDAADDMVPWVEGPTFYSDRYDAARRAVVEAVGPTREDGK